MNTNKKTIDWPAYFGRNITNGFSKLKYLTAAKRHIRKVIKNHKLHKLGSFYYKFPKGGGFTGLVSLVESHISIHTWPELKYLNLNVYLCNYFKDNSMTTKKVFEEIAIFFKPVKSIKRSIKR